MIPDHFQKGEKMEAEMLAKITRDSEILFEREVKITDETSDSIRPALLGFNQKLYEDAGKLFEQSPEFPNEIITIKIEHEIKEDGDRIFYNEITITAKRFIVVAGLWGIRNPTHEDVILFIKNHFNT